MMRPVSVAVPPIAASGLTSAVSGAGNNRRLTVTWSDNSITETSFLVQKSADGTTWTDVGTVSSPLDQPNVHQTRSMTDPATFNGNLAVRYRVVARNTVGYGAEFPSMTVRSVSAVLNVGTAPAAPTGLTAALQSGPRVSLAWTDRAANETGFVVERAANGGAFAPIATAPGRSGTGGVTFLDTGIVPGTTYQYRVAATNAIGLSAYTNTATVVVPALPAVPVISSATAAAQGSGERVTVVWGAVAGATGYRVQWSATAAFTSVAGTGTVGATTTFTSPQLPRQTWYVRVIATNLVGQSQPSAVSTVPAFGAVVAAVAAPVPMSVTRATIAPMIARAAFLGAGVPVAVTVPAQAQILRVRVVAAGAAGRAATASHRSRALLFTAFRTVKTAGRAHRMRFRLRSRVLHARVRPGRRYVLEITAGTSAKRLGQATRVAFRVR